MNIDELNDVILSQLKETSRIEIERTSHRACYIKIGVAFELDALNLRYIKFVLDTDREIAVNTFDG